MKRFLNRIVLILSLLIMTSLPMVAQTIAVRTNLAAWSLPVANVGIELVVTESNTVAFNGLVAMAPLKIVGDNTASLWGLLVEHRYWFAHQPFKTMFIGPVIGINYYKRQGIGQNDLAVPMGVGIGYDWALNRHWNLEAGLAAGWIYYTESSAELPNSVFHKTIPSLINTSLSAIYVF